MPWEDAGILGLYALIVTGLVGLYILVEVVRWLLGIGHDDDDNPCGPHGLQLL